MRVVAIASGRACKVVSVLPSEADDGADSELEVCLAEFSAYGGAVAKDVERLYALFDFIAEHGRMRATNFFHEADKSKGVYEFTKGNLRVYFTFEVVDGQLCLCSHAIRKKKQKADVRDVDRAANLAKDFRDAAKAKTLKIIEREEEI